MDQNSTLSISANLIAERKKQLIINWVNDGWSVEAINIIFCSPLVKATFGDHQNETKETERTGK